MTALARSLRDILVESPGWTVRQGRACLALCLGIRRRWLLAGLAIVALAVAGCFVIAARSDPAPQVAATAGQAEVLAEVAAEVVTSTPQQPSQRTADGWEKIANHRNHTGLIVFFGAIVAVVLAAGMWQAAQNRPRRV